MSMGSRKVNTEGIDEELLIASIGRRKQDGTLYRAQEPPVPAPEEESVPETEPPITEGNVHGEAAEPYPESETVESPPAQEENTDMTGQAQVEEGLEQPAMEESPEEPPEKAGAFYPIETDMPFAHLEELEQGILTSRDGQTGVFIPEEGQRDGQMFNRSPTGQWSEPMTSE